MSKERITITIDKKLLKWIDKQIAKFIFASRSHGFEYIIAEAVNKEVKK